MAVFLDIAYYVPLDQRNRKPPREDPYEEGQFVLGAVLSQGSLYKQSKAVRSDLEKYWIWEQPEFDPYENVLKQEEGLLEQIYQFMLQEYQRMMQMGKRTSYYVVGMGITHYDLPLLYNRSLLCDFATPQQLYQIYYTAIPIDLSSIAVGFRKKSGKLTLQPMKISEIKSEVMSSYKSQSILQLWELYDDLQFTSIESQITNEVLQIVELYHHIRRNIGR